MTRGAGVGCGRIWRRPASHDEQQMYPWFILKCKPVSSETYEQGECKTIHVPVMRSWVKGVDSSPPAVLATDRQKP